MGLLDDAIREHLDLKRRRGGDPAEIEKLEREALGPVRREASFADPDAAEFAPSAAVADRPADHDDAPTAYAEAPVDQGAYDDSDPLGPDAFGALPAAVSPPAVPSPGADRPARDLPDPGRDAVTPVPAGEPVDPLEEPAASERESGAEVATPRGGIAAPDYADPEFDDFTSERGDRPEPKHRFGFLHRRRHHHDAEPDPGPVESGHGPDPSPPSDPSSVESLPTAPAAADALPGSSEPPMLRITPEANLGETVEYDVEGAFAAEAGSEHPPARPAEDPLEETPDFLADTPDHDRLWFEQKPPPDFDFE